MPVSCFAMLFQGAQKLETRPLTGGNDRTTTSQPKIKSKEFLRKLHLSCSVFKIACFIFLQKNKTYPPPDAINFLPSKPSSKPVRIIRTICTLQRQWFCSQKGDFIKTICRYLKPVFSTAANLIIIHPKAFELLEKLRMNSTYLVACLP